MKLSEETLKVLVKQLAQAYMKHPMVTAEICDTVLDTSGGLLGRVREEVRVLQKEQENLHDKT